MKENYLFILTLGTFSIINTEMGIIGILPMISSDYNVDIATAGLLVSLFALAVALSGPFLPLLFSGWNRKYVMLMVLSMFMFCNIIAAFTTNFYLLLATRVIPAFFHPVYVALAFAVASTSVSTEEIPKAVAKVMIGVSAGMVLGVPIVSYLATSTQFAMLSFAFVNALALLATIIFVPSLPVTKQLSYSTQLSILKKTDVWLAFSSVVFLNGAIFGVYSYLAEYLETVTRLSTASISLLLLAYGLANIIGNLIAGKLLSSNPYRFTVLFPLLLTILYLAFFFVGSISFYTALILFIWGVLAGAGTNLNQYWITSAAPHVPDFANGLFLVAANLGTSIGTIICGYFISRLGSEYVVLGGIAFVILGIITIFLRIRSPWGKFSACSNTK